MRIVDAARYYRSLGWNPQPAHPQSKKPVDEGWLSTTVPEERYEESFADGRNIAIVLGASSNNVYDVDLDEMTTVKMARRFLPKTPAIFGRSGKPLSHWIYQGLPEEEIKRKQFFDGDTLLAEIRGNKCGTIFPPSLHAGTGELIEWRDPARIAPSIEPVANVTKTLGWACSASMLSRHWEEWNDKHHTLVGALAGGFARTGMISAKVAEDFVRAICHETGDHQPDDRIRIVRDTYLKYEADPDEPISGFPTLRELIGSEKFTKLRLWLQLPAVEDKIANTDSGNAYRFVDAFGEDLRYVHDHSSWYGWTGSLWLKDTQENAVALARSVPSMIFKDAEKITDEEQRNQLVKWSLKSQAAERIFAIPKLAKTDDRVKTRSEDLDADPWLFNVGNGTINLQTGSLYDHDRTDLLTKRSPVEYHARGPKATCPRWLSYLEEAFEPYPEVPAFLKRLVGYTLTGITREQIFVVLLGPQGTGKTTFIETLRLLFGSYAVNAEARVFLQKTGSGSRATPEIAALQGARLVTSPETEQGDKLATALIKRMSGSGRITASHLYAAPFEYDPVMKLWIDTNVRPHIPANDDAMYARLVVLPFEVVFRHTERDIKGYRDILATELPGILRWAIEGCLEWQADGLARPKAVDAAGETYRADSDTFASFLEDACSIGPELTCTASELYATYVDWARETNERPLNMRVFKSRMIERGYETKRSETGNIWLGVRPNRTSYRAQPFTVPSSEGSQGNPFTSRPVA